MEKHLKETYCLECGTLLSKTQKKFCSNSCAAKYNNKNRVQTEACKEKIRNALINFHKDKNTKIVICKCCGKTIAVKKYKNRTSCSHTCANNYYKDSIKIAQAERIKLGICKSWQSRNITSYPERFWETVLINNNIEYKREDFSTKKYFLDFLITKNNKNIDLEIDGKQHNYPERTEKDSVRDKYLTDLGYIVYRVKWNSINSEKGKQEMQNKIDEFIAFYNNI